MGRDCTLASDIVTRSKIERKRGRERKKERRKESGREREREIEIRERGERERWRGRGGRDKDKDNINIHNVYKGGIRTKSRLTPTSINMLIARGEGEGVREKQG